MFQGINTIGSVDDLDDLPLVSIIVPIYKVQRYLPACIESILNQTYSKLEIVLVDDGSPDECSIICDKYAKSDNRIVVIHKENQGLVCSRKTGLLSAHGLFVSYIDGDDWIDIDYIETLVSIALRTDVDVVASGFTKNLEDSAKRYYNLMPIGYYDRPRIEKEVLLKLIFSEEDNYPGVFSYVWNKLFKLDKLMDFQLAVPNDVFLGEDAACVYPLLAEANSIFITDYCGYHYRQRPDSMLKTKGNISGKTKENKSVQIDINALQVLNNYLYKTFEQMPKRFGLVKQAERFVLFLLASRSGGIIKIGSRISSFVYGEKIMKKKVVVLGAGTMGQHTYSNIKMFQCCDVIVWADEDFVIYQKHGYDVQNPSQITDNVDLDYVLIAMLDFNMANKAKRKLIQQGIPMEKIVLANINCLKEDVFEQVGIKLIRCTK